MGEGISRPGAFLLAVFIFAIDRVSKYLIETRLTAFDVKTVIPGFFDIVKSQNPGVAFGLLADSPTPGRTAVLVAFSLAALVAVAAMLWRIVRLDRATALGLSLIFGGALGNVFDRVVRGTVTDFLDFHFGSYHWYTFNIADSAITVGAMFVLFSMMRPAKTVTS